MEKRAAEVVIVSVILMVFLSSCGTSSYYTACPGVDGGRASGCQNAWSAR